MLNYLKRIFKPEVSPRRAYLDKFRLNLQCPKCDKWTHECSPNSAPQIVGTGHPMAVGYDCLGCSERSYWVCEAGFWFSASKFNITDDECRAYGTKEQHERQG